MGAYQYCECGRGLNPSPDEVINGHITCTCGLYNDIVYGDDMKADLLKQLVRDVAYLMSRCEEFKDGVTTYASE